MYQPVATENRDAFLGVRLLTSKQLMEELQVSAVSLWKWRCDGMPFVPIGHRMVRYRMPEVMEWLADRKTASRAS
jgi:predicted DNA-binding transcriptional regulator AlpA